MLKKFTLTAAAALTALTAIPAAADAHPRGRTQYHDNGAYAQSYRGQTYANRNYTRCRSGTTGMIVGGGGGALLGRELAGRRSRGTGTILGAAAGALLGREVTRDKRCR